MPRVAYIYGKGFLEARAHARRRYRRDILSRNFLVIAVYSVLGVSTPVDANVVGGIIEGSPADGAGLKVGDRIQGVDGTPVLVDVPA